MRKGKEIDFLVLMRAKLGGSAKVAQILEEDIKDGAAYLVTSASGSPANFPDGADDIPVVDLKVSIEPAQSGSGDPSPDNVRPISGWTGVTLSHSGADTSDPETLTVSWQSEAGTVYGGTLDVTTGVLTVDRVNEILKGVEPWAAYGVSSYRFAVQTNNGFPDKAYGQTNVISDRYQVGGYNSNRYVGIVNGQALYSTADDLKTYLTQQYALGTPASICYELATPITYQLTPTEVKTMLGDNNIWADCGGVDVEYRADLDKYIEKRKNPTDAGTLGLSLGAAPSMIRSGVGFEMQPLGLDDAGVNYIDELPDADEYLGDLEDDEDSYPEEPEEELTEEPEEGSDDDQGN